jgi:hypothetical protein
MKNTVLSLEKKRAMQNTKCLVITCGYFGDIMFSTSLAPKLINQYDQVDYLIGFPQMKVLLENDPIIHNVFTSDTPNPYPTIHHLQEEYSRVIQLQPLNYLVTPCEEYQQFAGFTDVTAEYKIYTLSQYDLIAKEYVEQLKKEHNKPVIGIMTNWEPKTYLFTPDQYKKGIDVPNLGYGGSHRNVQYIVNELINHFTLVPIGMGNLSQYQTSNISDDDSKSLTFEASLLKACDAFIGTEGGLANLAAGVGCKTILTGDFIHQLYGWNGVLKKIKEPKLGPIYYFPNDGHIVLDPYLTDNEIINKIINLLQ